MVYIQWWLYSNHNNGPEKFNWFETYLYNMYYYYNIIYIYTRKFGIIAIICSWKYFQQKFLQPAYFFEKITLYYILYYLKYNGRTARGRRRLPTYIYYIMFSKQFDDYNIYYAKWFRIKMKNEKFIGVFTCTYSKITTIDYTRKNK